MHVWQSTLLSEKIPTEKVPTEILTQRPVLAGLPQARGRHPDGLVHAKDAGLSLLFAKVEKTHDLL